MSPSIKRLAVLGAGTMGEALIAALLDAGTITASTVVATAKHRPRLEHLRERFGIETTLDNLDAVADADVVLLCVKPQIAPDVLDTLRGVLRDGQLVISIVAGLTTRRMETLLGEGAAVVRSMPNTPSRIGHGMTVVCGGRCATDDHLAVARGLFNQTGRCLVLDERHFNAATGLSGSGPAFLYIIIEALAEGGVKAGLPRVVATELAAQTCLGAAKMVLETGHHPAMLKDEVTTPAGCTVDGILTLEEGGLRVTLIKAIIEASRRAGELGEVD